MNNEKLLKLIIIDDEKVIRNGLKKAINLEKLNLCIIGDASSGKEAFEKIESLKPDIVITDIKMPVIDGLELIKKTREKNIDCDFIILSGYDDFNYAKKAIKLGAKEYLLKPIDTNELNDTLEQIAIKKRYQLELNNFFDSKDLAFIKKQAKKKYFEKIIFNNLTSIEELKKLKELDINLELSNFKLIIFSYHENIESLFTIINNKFSKLKHESWIHSNSQIISIINLNQIENYSNYFKFLFLNTPINQKLLTIGISESFNNIDQINFHYNQVLSAISYQIYYENKNIFYCSKLKTKIPNLQTNNLDIDSIVSLILQNDKIGISNYCKKFFHALFYTKTPPPSYTKGMCIFLIAEVQKTLIKEFNLKNEDFPKIEYEKINSYKNFEEIKNWINSILLDYSNLSAIFLKKSSSKIVKPIEDYIKNNLSKKIMLEDLSNILHISESHLAAKFKDIKGINIRTYILNEKCNHAKKLLLNKTYSIESISLEVGYEDYRSFYRVFKKQTGYSPSQFRKLFLK